MSSPPSTLVWFLLVESATGLPYKGTSATAVSLPPDSIIAEFQYAVKTEYSSKLSSVDVGDLLVYKNKAAFDKRNLENKKVLFIFIIATGRAPRRRFPH